MGILCSCFQRGKRLQGHVLKDAEDIRSAKVCWQNSMGPFTQGGELCVSAQCACVYVHRCAGKSGRRHTSNYGVYSRQT